MEISDRAVTTAPSSSRRRGRFRFAIALLAATLLAPVLVALAPSTAGAYAGAPWFRPGYAYNANFPDATVVWDGSRYWAYGTSTGGSLMPAMSSTDLQTWVPRPAYSPNPYNSDPFFNDSYPVPPRWSSGGTSRTAKAQWAPGVVNLGGTWVAYTSWEVSPGRRCISVARSSSPAGPFIDNSSQPFVCDTDPGGSIDPSPFIDTNGQPYLMWKSSGVPGSAPTKIKSRALSADGMSFAPGSSPVAILQTELGWEGNSIENPSMVRYNGTYWLIYSGNEWESASYRTGQAACAGPLGPCSRSSQSPLIENTASEWSPGGGSLFVDTAGRLRTIYQVWNAPYTSYPTNPNCDAPGLCQTQGQRYYRIDGLAVSAGHLTVDPVGNLEQVTPVSGAIDVSGWALDPSTTGPIAVHVYVDGNVAAVAASGARPDVAAAYPNLGTNHGFSVRVGASPGVHQVCAYGIGVGTPVNPQLGCRTVNVAGADPRGSLDRADGVPGGVTASGWAIDPDTTAPIQVHVYVDGVGAATTASQTRPDVGAAFPASGSNHGYTVTVPASPGRHTACAYGINVGPGSVNTQLGCRTVDVPDTSPVGSLDQVTPVAGGVRVAGWAIDPETAQPIDVHLYVDAGALAVRADQDRPDVGAAFPAYGSRHGYSQALGAAPGTHRVCAYGINVGAGTNRLLGCRTVTVG